ncbi:MAG: hypothetical protein DRQ55_09695 [Planctomycetota bacterium]|nr:MAG: hypothetical protein DRQ55_09695 [Planctomycetota bacterium]
MRITTALDRYVLQLQADGRSPHTIVQVQRHVRLLATWMATQKQLTDVRRLRHEHLAAFLADPETTTRADGQPKLPTTLNALRTTMRSFGSYCDLARYAPRNFGGLVRRARVGPRPPRALTEGESKRLVAALDEAQTPAERRDRALFRVMLATGIRVGSALEARTDDVDLEAGALHLRHMKGGGTLLVPLDEAVRALLAEYVEGMPTGALFPSKDGDHLQRRSIALRFKAWIKRAGITRAASPHSLRHTFATRLYEASHDLMQVQQRLGHASIVSSTVYARAGAI